MRLPRLRPLVLLPCVPACQGWHRRDLPPPGSPPAAASDMGRLRVTHADGRVLELRGARLVGVIAGIVALVLSRSAPRPNIPPL